ncbi:MAG: hypothetical protein ACBR15_02440 [Microcoleus sp.]
MTTPPNPLTPTPTPSSPTPVEQSPPVNTRSGKLTQKVVMNVLEFVDQVFYGLMGPLGRTVYGSIQDAIALGILVKLPGLIFQTISDKKFDDFTSCSHESPWGSSFYFCFIIIGSDFLLLIVILGRTFIRFWRDLKDLRNNP